MPIDLIRPPESVKHLYRHYLGSSFHVCGSTLRTVEANMRGLHNRGEAEVLLPFLEHSISIGLALLYREPQDRIPTTPPTETSQITRDQAQDGHSIILAHIHILVPPPSHTPVQTAVQYALAAAASRLPGPSQLGNDSAPVINGHHTVDSDTELMAVWKTADQEARGQSLFTEDSQSR